MNFETGRVARQANGAVVVRLGETVVMVTACAQKKPREGVDFLPLTVDYRENTYAAGKIPGGFFKREGRPNDKETLTSRLIDRPLRPLFPKGWSCETQVIALVLSADIENDPDILGVTGASTALMVSDIPYDRAMAAVRVGLIEGRYVINPTTTELQSSKLDLVVAGTGDAVVMVESGAQEVTWSEALGAIYAGHEEIKTLVALQHRLRETVGLPKRAFSPPAADEDLERAISSRWGGKLAEAMMIRGKLESYATVDRILEEILAEIPEEDTARRRESIHIFHELQNSILHEEILQRSRRLDGRRFDEIRAITCEVGVLPRTHGSSLFTRGETQALVTTTLGTSSDAQIIDWMEERTEKRFMLHYNFPPFSGGEVRFLRGPGRREIGHGNLAERSLRPMIPSNEEFPYTIRQVSDILDSNGTSSMASVCGGPPSRVDAAVPATPPAT